jgi:hypothetical protein
METELLNYFQSHPWATAGDASRALGCDRANAKRDCKKLKQRGLLQYRINGQAYEWAVTGGNEHDRTHAASLGGLDHGPNLAVNGNVNGQVIDDQPIRLSPSRALGYPTPPPAAAVGTPKRILALSP